MRCSLHWFEANRLSAVKRLTRAAKLLMVGLLLSGCGTSERPLDIELAGLVDAANELNGRQVRTMGIVRQFPDPFHVWIENAQFQRVGLEPSETAIDYLGQTVRVSGRFRIDPEHGRLIVLTGIEPATLHPHPSDDSHGAH